MRGLENDPSARTPDAMQLFHRRQHVADVLDHVDHADLVEQVVAEGIRRTIQVADHVRRGVRIAIDADRAGVLVAPASYVQDFHGLNLTTDAHR